MANDVTLTLENAYIGSAYSPIVEVTDVTEGHEVSITSADPESAGHVVTHSFVVKDGGNAEDYQELSRMVREATEELDDALEALPATVKGDVDQWLDDHPEATTTVQDNSLPDAKLIQTGGILSLVHDARMASFGLVSGYWNAGRNIAVPTETGDEVTTTFIPVKPGMRIKLNLRYPSQQNGWLIRMYLAADGSKTGSRTVMLNEKVTEWESELEVPSDSLARYVSFSYRRFVSGTLTVSYLDEIPYELTNMLDRSLGILMPDIAITETSGVIQSDGTIADSESPNYEVYTSEIPVASDTSLFVRVRAVGSDLALWVACAVYDALDVMIGYHVINGSTSNYKGSDWVTSITVTEVGARSVRICYATYGDANHGITVKYANPYPMLLDLYDIAKSDVRQKSYDYKNSPVKSVNHRGYNTVAPENTLPAFRLSKVQGFDIVETDIRLTSDGVPVLLHDEKINRTARNPDGTEISSQLKIMNLTFEQARSYDYGIWKGDEYAGTQIPTLEEGLTLCRNINLHMYLELESSSITTRAQVEQLIEIVRSCGMQDKVTWISFSNELLSYVVDVDPFARVGQLKNESTVATMDQIAALRTGMNEVFLNCYRPLVNDTLVQECMERKIPLEMWTANNPSQITSMPTYVTGFTSDQYIAEKVLYDANIEG